MEAEGFSKAKKSPTLNAPRALASGFLAAIVIGTLLLWLPVSHQGGGVGFVDALFTSTSAVCVTGLTTVDTGGDFSLFGQIVILALIQIGGLGIMTFSTLLVLYMGGAISLRLQMILKEALNRLTYANLGRIAKVIIIVTLVFELIGALFLLPVFLKTFPLPTAVYYSVFHSVSAFCNAGFSLFPDSLTRYHHNPPVIITMSLLIIAGGIGFPVLLELAEWRPSKKFSLHAKLVLSITAALILIGAAGIFIFEYDHNIDFHEGRSAGRILLTAFFQSVSARTAGFNTVNVGGLSTATLFILMILMFIGASPGGTGGGIKTTTFGLIAATAWAIVRGRKDVNVFGRRITEHDLLRAFTIALLFLVMIAAATMLMLCIKSFGLASTLFEVMSATGTVGLSTGITSSLAPAEKMIIIVTMFCGRLGPLTIAMALIEREGRQTVRFPEGKILIG
ncbi:MAG: TrkH family potassium uptake protein [bacterium]